VRLEELGQLKNPMTSSGIEPVTILNYISTSVVANATTDVRSKTSVEVFYLLGHNAV
jgi:hypothetical protein